MTILANLLYDEISHFYVVGNKKHYLTANIFYGGVHWAIRSKIVDYAKAELLQYISAIPPLKDFPIHIEVGYHSSKKTFDIDNKAYFWAKVFIDLIKTKKFVPDDNVRFISSIKMIHYPLKGGNDMLEITIKQP